jgi:hypothetical protein
MDLWAANIPSEVLDVEEDGSIFFPASERSRTTEKSSKLATSLLHKGNKRPSTWIGEPESSAHAAKHPRQSSKPDDLGTPVRKKGAAEALPTPFSESPLRETVSAIHLHGLTCLDLHAV